MLFSNEAFQKVLDIDLETAVGWKGTSAVVICKPFFSR